MEPIIPNCLIYAYKYFDKWAYVCTKCQAQYFLENEKSCKAVTVITNCVEYSPTANTTQCVRCNEDNILSGNACQTRTKITDCTTHDATTNTCSVCKTGLVKNQDSTACKAALANCKTY